MASAPAKATKGSTKRSSGRSQSSPAAVETPPAVESDDFFADEAIEAEAAAELAQAQALAALTTEPEPVPTIRGHVVVCAGSKSEAERWAAENGVKGRNMIFASGPSRIETAVFGTVVYLPGFKTARNRHAVEAVVRRIVRRNRDIQIIDARG